MAEQVVQVQQERIRQQEKEQLRKRLEQHARHINSCDGTVREQLRDWIESVTAAKLWTKAGDELTIEMVGYLSKGALRTSVANRVNTVNTNGHAATWDDVCAHITATFLDEDEAEYKRQGVDNIRQLPYQDSREYAINFQTAVQQAYSPQELAVDLVAQRLVKTFISGLLDEDTRMQIHIDRPLTLQQAVTRANAITRARAMGKAESRREEPMEIGSLSQSIKAADRNEELFKTVKEIAGGMKGLQKRLGNVEKQVEELTQQPQRRVREQKAPNYGQGKAVRKFGKPAYNDDGTPNCFRCGKAGHIGRNCPLPQNGVSGNA